MMGFVAICRATRDAVVAIPSSSPRPVGRHQRHDRQAVQQRHDQAEEDPRLPQPRGPTALKTIGSPT